MLEHDTDAVVAVWLAASLHGHGFIDPRYWESRQAAMRDAYLPASLTHVYEEEGRVIGFCSLVDETLAALFVLPEHHGRGVGSRLLANAKKGRKRLRLTVYAQNDAAVGFYRERGFTHTGKRIDEETGQAEQVMEWRAVE